MATPFPEASITLDCPLYAVEFDPQDANRLVVGGGGGAGRSGVGNKITVLETASPDELRKAGEINLSRDEDSVMSLALGPQKGRTSYLYAGINSSPASIAKGQNEHLRTFAIEQTRAAGARPSSANSVSAITKAPAAKIAEVARTSMFGDLGQDVYQRRLRVVNGLGAAATALGKESQLALFEVSAATPNPKPRGVMELPREIEDLDIVQTGEDEYQLAFCYKYELHVINIDAKNVSAEPELIFTMPEENDERPSFGSLRYLSKDFILAASNMPGGKGVILQGLRLPTPGHEKARVAVAARIPAKIKATALAVTNLSPLSSPTAVLGTTQFVIAIAGNDASIWLYTLNHSRSENLTLLTHLHSFYTIKEAHGPVSVTSLAFSTFVTPKTHLRKQSIKLASTSLGNSVAVHSIPLTQLIDKTPRNKKGPPRPVRYVVAMKSRKPTPKPLILTLSIMVLVMAMMGQGLLEMLGHSKPILGVHRFLPSWHGTLRSADHQPPALMDEAFIAKIMGRDQQRTEGEKIVILEAEQQQEQQGDHTANEGGEDVNRVVEPVREIKVDVHKDELHGETKEWEALSEEQKEAWREKLGEAGTWTRDMGESVFRGILFGQLAGAVGQAFEA